MKFAEDIFPIGTFKGQQTAGAYIDGTLASNLDILAKKITNDMHFCGLVTGHDGVRNGKTTVASQIGTYLTWKINQLHGTNLTFTDKNIVMQGKNLDKTSFENPQHSVIVLDEGDDLVTHGSKQLAVSLKRYFRKCGQLNQILILILPSFFELPKFFALNRTHFLIDTKFHGEFERGTYSFYSSRNKKLLYLKGKRDWNYEAYKHDFGGAFTGHYYFFPDLEGCVRRYKDKKRYDLEHDDDENQTPQQIKKELTSQLFSKVYNNLDGVSVDKLSKAFGVCRKTGFTYLKEQKQKENTTLSGVVGNGKEELNILSKKDNAEVEDGIE